MPLRHLPVEVIKAPSRDSRADPEFTGWIMYLRWSGTDLGSSEGRWRESPARGRSGFSSWTCWTCNPNKKRKSTGRPVLNVLTKLSCFFHSQPKKDLEVVMGSLSRGKLDPTAQTVKVEHSIRHENYRETPHAVYNDIGNRLLHGLPKCPRVLLR